MSEPQSEPLDIQDLLERAGGGDRGALDTLFERYRDYLQRFVRLRLAPRLRQRVDPSDVVQEAQLEAVRRLADYLERRPLPFRLWMRQLAYDRILKLHRHHVEAARRSLDREVPLPDGSALALAGQLLASGSTPSQHVSREELARRIRSAIEELSDNDREILLLRNLEGLSNQEAATVLGVEPATASQRHGRALLRLHRVLFAGGVTDAGP